MAARAIGSGTISFGLVSIPVKLFSSSAPASAITFNNLHGECGTRLKQQYHCPKCEVVVPRDGSVKGYEVMKGKYVTFTAEEIKAVSAQSTGGIDVEEFVPADRVDPIYFDKAYYLGPDKGAARAYHLLAEAMRQTGLCGMGRYAARGKSYLVLLRPVSKGIILQQLHHDWELRSFEDVDMEDAEVKRAELDLAMQLISQAAAEDFQPARYEDEVRARVEELIERKVEGEDITAVAGESPKAQVIDLMDALKASLGISEGGDEGSDQADAEPDAQRTSKAAKGGTKKASKAKTARRGPKSAASAKPKARARKKG